MCGPSQTELPMARGSDLGENDPMEDSEEESEDEEEEEEEGGKTVLFSWFCCPFIPRLSS